MSVQARVNQLFGGADATSSIAITSATTSINIPAISSFINISSSGGAATLGASGVVFTMPASARGRLLIFHNNGSNSITFTNTDSTTTAGYMDLGGSNFVLGATDILAVFVRGDGSAIRLFSADN